MTDPKTIHNLLDEIQQREICAILAMGCSRRVAARYIGETRSIIALTAARNEAFRQRLDQAEQRAEIEFMRNIQDAAKKSQYWRAAAWALERRCPDDYGPRRAGTLTFDQVRNLLTQVAEIVIQEIPAASQRKKVLHRLQKLTGEIEVKV